LLWLTASLWLSTTAGCKKENNDTQKPSITIHSPSGGSTFYFNDDIPISATINDETNLKYISVQIINAQNHVFLNQVEYSNSGTQKEISTSISHNDLYLPSGIYYVKIVAKDDHNESMAFREIQLIEAPLELDRIYLVRGNGSSTQMDTIGNSNAFAFSTLPFIYSCGAINSRYNRLAVGSNDYIRVHHATSLLEQNSYHHNTSTILKTIYDKHTESFFMCTIDGYIFQIDRNGSNSIFSYLPQQKILNLLVTENYVFADVTNLNETIRTISVFNKSTRAFIQSVQVDFDMKEFIYLGNEDKVLVVGNQSGEGVLRYYNRTTNFFNEIFTAYNHSIIYGAWTTAPNRFIVSHADGLITYNYEVQTLSNGLNIQPVRLIHEKISGINYAVKENGVHVLNTNATTQIGFIPASNCKDILLLYNK